MISRVDRPLSTSLVTLTCAEVRPCPARRIPAIEGPLGDAKVNTTV